MSRDISLVRTLAAMVQEAGTAHADALAPRLPQYTRKQVIKALQNGASMGLICCVDRLPRIHGRGKGLGVYAIANEPKRPAPQRIFPRAASVWDYAAGQAR